MKKEGLVMPAVILCLIGIVVTGMLALTHQFTKDIIEGQAGEQQASNREQIFPGAALFVEIELDTLNVSTENVREFFIAVDEQDELLGALIVAHAAGYSGEVPVMVGIRPDGIIAAARVLPNSETPNLGTQIEEPDFIDQFQDLDLASQFTLRTPESGEHRIDSVTAATESSRAVVNAINTIAEVYAEIELTEIFSEIDLDAADMEVE